MIKYVAFLVIFLFACSLPVTTFSEKEDAVYFQSSSLSSHSFYDSLKVMTWNIRFGAGRIPFFGDSCGERALMTESETKRYLDEIIIYLNIHQPDILLIQEIDISSKRSAYLNQLQYILDNTYFNYSAYASMWDVQIVPSDGLGKVDAGNAIFSRWEIKNAERIQLALRTDQDILTQYFYLRRNILKAQIIIPDFQEIYAVNIHATAFATDDTKQKHIDEYKNLLDELDNSGAIFVTGGDLNSIPPNASTQDFCLLDMCDGEKFHNKDDGGPHREGSYFNNFEGESNLIKQFYINYYPAIDTLLINNPEHLTHSPWNTNSINKEYWDRKLDYLFTNDQNWTNTGSTDNTIQNISDHAPVSAILYFD